MRIAIFAETYFPFISGVVTHIQTLKEGLEAAGHKVLIVTMSPSAKRHYIEDGVLYCPAIALKKIYGYGIANPLNYHRLRILERFNPDIIHIHTEFTMGRFALFAAKKLKKPVVYTLHTMYDDYVFYLFPEKMNKLAKPAAHAYIRNMASHATEIIGPSVKVVNYLRRCGVTRHINIVPNTVDVTSFLSKNVDKNAVKEAADHMGLQEGDVSLCFVGRLGPEKSIDVLIDYFAQGFKDEHVFKLVIIGEGPEKDALFQQVKERGVEKQVRIMGRIEHELLPAYYHACNLFATASLTEMNSISLLEATASGLYALQRLDIYNRDQIVSGKNGEVFTSQKEFEQYVWEYATLAEKEKNERREMVTQYAMRYGKHEFTQQIENVYERALAGYKKK